MTKAVTLLTLLSTTTVSLSWAQPAEPTPPAPAPTPPTQPAPTAGASVNATVATPVTTSNINAGATLGTPPPQTDKPEEPKQEGGEKKHKFGDFDAGGQARFPNGPDEMGEFKSFNWVAVDLKGAFFLLPSVTVNAVAPLAVKKPDTIGPMGPEPSLFGGMKLELDAKIPGTQIGAAVGLAYMKEGALLLSEKDFPAFIGDYKPGVTAGLKTRVKLSNVVDLNVNPLIVHQSGTTESLTAVQVPLSLTLKLGSLLKVGADAGINTGDDFKIAAEDGGRISAGGMMELKIGKLLFHAGAGVASLLTGGLYPTIGDSVYVDVNAKYVK